MARSLLPTIPPPTWRRIDARGVIQITAAEGAILYRCECLGRRGEAPPDNSGPTQILPCVGPSNFTGFAHGRRLWRESVRGGNGIGQQQLAPNRALERGSRGKNIDVVQKVVPRPERRSPKLLDSS